jgi:hypothetical protein
LLVTAGSRIFSKVTREKIRDLLVLLGVVTKLAQAFLL